MQSQNQGLQKWGGERYQSPIQIPSVRILIMLTSLQEKFPECCQNLLSTSKTEIQLERIEKPREQGSLNNCSSLE